MKLASALALFMTSLIWAAHAEAAALPNPGTLDPRIQTIQYDPNQVVLLQGTLGYQFMLEFGSGEKIETVSIGDALGWQVTPNRNANVLFVKPVLRSTTNLTVLTNERRYAYELKVVPQRTSVPVLYIARMIYPQPVLAVVVPPPPPPPEPPPVVANYYYTMSGSKTGRPLHIFDDGHKTYFQWAPESALPAIFAVSDDGSESLVNYVLRGPYVVVDQVATGFRLRNGKDVTKVANHGPSPVAGSVRR
jgi:type IV secretion system protein VirB9